MFTKSQLYNLLMLLDQEMFTDKESWQLELIRCECIERRIACGTYPNEEAQYASIEEYERLTGQIFEIIKE